MEKGGGKLEGKVVVLVDMDCFYVQVEKKLHPELKDKPCAIVQYNKWQGGSIIAVDYEARKYGVKRSLKGNEAKEKCPNIHLVQVPEKRGKADLTNYRKASGEVMKVLSQFTSVIERASIDEAFLDLTAPVREYVNSGTGSNEKLLECLTSTHVAGCCDEELDTDESDLRLSRERWLKSSCSSEERVLIVGAMLCQRIRDAILHRVGFTCSAGISYNKMLAKLAAGMNKPNQQTILPQSQVSNVFSTTLLNKVRHLGGKLGDQIQKQLNIEYVGQLQQYTLKMLQGTFGPKTGLWLFELCRGICHDKINNRIITKSIGCSKNFLGPTKLKTAKTVKYWLEQLSGELVERLEEDMTENMRQAQTLTVHFLAEGRSSSVARTFPLPSYNLRDIVTDSWNAINKGHKPAMDEDSQLTWTTGILNIHLSASKFVQCSKGHMKSLLQLMSSDLQEDDSNTSSSNTITSASSSSLDIVAWTPEKEESQCRSYCEEDRGYNVMEEGTEEERSEEHAGNESSRESDQDISSAGGISKTSELKQSSLSSAMSIKKFFTPLKRKGSPETLSTPERETMEGNKRMKSEAINVKEGKAIAREVEWEDKERTLVTNDDDDEVIDDNQFEVVLCSECGEEILRLLLEEHMDYHIALLLLQKDSIPAIKNRQYN